LNSNEGRDAFEVYMAIRLHFTTDYDFFRYNGKTRVTEQSWLSRSDKFFFKKIKRDYGSDLVNFFVSNYMDGQELWSKELIGKRARRNYEEFTLDGHYTIFKRDCERLSEAYGHITKLLEYEEGAHPILMKEYITERVHPITMIILESFIHYSKTFPWDDKQWIDIVTYLKNLKPFIKFDYEKCSELYENTLT